MIGACWPAANNNSAEKAEILRSVKSFKNLAYTRETMAKLDEIVLVKAPKSERLVLKVGGQEVLGNIAGLDPITLYFWEKKFNEEEFGDYVRDYGNMRAENALRLKSPNDNTGGVIMGIIIDSFRKKYGIEKGKDEAEERNYLRLLQMHFDRQKGKLRHRKLADVPLRVHYFLMRMAYFDHFPPAYMERRRNMESRYFMHGVPSLKDRSKE